MEFDNAQHAFEVLYPMINLGGEKYGNTKALFDIGFTINNPMDNKIKTKWRNWNEKYADLEWGWYLSGKPDVSEIKKHAKIWDNMHGGDNIVNSNYGYQWNRNDQLNYVIQELKRDNNSRRACISIYDAKEHHKYKYDTPCTISINFYIKNNRLNMSVLMRSNDLWFGFCNDQYCFSHLVKCVADELDILVGTYFHYATNLHLYNNKLNKNI
jgi:thymidylate synthase